MLPVSSGEGENIFSLLIKLTFVYIVKKENTRMRKKPHLLRCKGRAFLFTAHGISETARYKLRQSWDHKGWGWTGISWFPNNSCVLWMNPLRSLMVLISICRMGVSKCRICKLPWGRTLRLQQMLVPWGQISVCKYTCLKWSFLYRNTGQSFPQKKNPETNPFRKSMCKCGNCFGSIT